jgi:hypothetical protein
MFMPARIISGPFDAAETLTACGDPDEYRIPALHFLFPPSIVTPSIAPANAQTPEVWTVMEQWSPKVSTSMWHMHVTVLKSKAAGKGRLPSALFSRDGTNLKRHH